MLSIKCFNGAANKTLAELVSQLYLGLCLERFNGAANKTLAEFGADINN